MTPMLEWIGHIIANGMPLPLALSAALCIVFGWGREWDERARHRSWLSAAQVTALSMAASPLVSMFLFTSLPWILRNLAIWTFLKPLTEIFIVVYAPLLTYFILLTLPIHGMLHDMHVGTHVYCSMRDCGFLTDWRRSYSFNEWAVITETVRLFAAYALQTLLSFLLIRAALAVRARRSRPERP
ncbi:hypothetical protein [Azospirillum agricola]|uniref:hypothetical protein n=1 Tax=Azospirillum agricola TaxID=1720247 RepID=UPI000A0F3838|nr:hypothetical protein [Azospirillum agricola]SMH59458.1 hypothetical protein SAMN02982994_5066 [Azospirillum lipoferum]